MYIYLLIYAPYPPAVRVAHYKINIVGRKAL